MSLDNVMVISFNQKEDNMSEQCKGNWHDYPNCEMCPMLGDSCDGSDEWNEEQEENDE